LFAGEEEKRKREKWWVVAAGKREGEVSRVRMGNDDGRPSDASDIHLEAFPIIKSSPRVNIFGESLPLGFR
jgi:hypothetical protein